MGDRDGGLDCCYRWLRPACPAGQADGPYEPAGMGAGIILARPGALLNDPTLFQPDMTLGDDGPTALPPRHNDGSVRPPYASTTRGHSGRAEHHCGHSLRILGEPMSMRAELGGNSYALEHVASTKN